MPTAANEGKWRPTKNRYVFFCTVHFIFHFLITTKPTKAHSSQRRPTRVNVGPQHPTKVNAGPRRRKRDRYVFFCNVHFIFHFLITTKPTKAHSSQRRPTQVNEGPQRPTTANAGQRRLTKAHSGQRRPTQATQAHTFRPYVCFFFMFC